ncbi:hypothetical protein D3C73_1629790 [compost metagenome]|jgi:hypothetical protein
MTEKRRNVNIKIIVKGEEYSVKMKIIHFSVQKGRTPRVMKEAIAGEILVQAVISVRQ